MRRFGAEDSTLPPLPRPEAWMEDAACAYLPDPDRWHPRGKPSRLLRRQAEPFVEVRAICGACPVRVKCLEHGMNEDDGIYGGLTPQERHQIKRERRRG